MNQPEYLLEDHGGFGYNIIDLNNNQIGFLSSKNIALIELIKVAPLMLSTLHELIEIEKRADSVLGSGMVDNVMQKAVRAMTATARNVLVKLYLPG